jgi:acyl-coenzyme A thioesterase PaaI-like protein
VQVDLRPYVTNSIGTINGGVLAIMIERAAEAMRPGHVATDLQIHYLAQIRTGPARTRGSLSRDEGGHSVATVEVVDHGAGDALLTSATVTLQEPPD